MVDARKAGPGGEAREERNNQRNTEVIYPKMPISSKNIHLPPQVLFEGVGSEMIFSREV